MSTFKHKASKGSIIVDAACCLPIFIIALCTILMLIAQTGVEDTVFHNMSEAVYASVTSFAGLSDIDDTKNERTLIYSAYSAALYKGLTEEWPLKSASSVYINDFECDQEATLSDGSYIDRLVSVDVNFRTKVPILAYFTDDIRSSRSVLFRPWVGESSGNTEFNGTQVYIFPKRGEHYHNSNCSCLKNGEIQIILSKSIRRKYRSCSTCHSDQMTDGSSVFLMSGISGVYHRKSCPCVNKAFESIALSDAQSMGYSPCSLCGGTPDNYNPENDYFK